MMLYLLMGGTLGAGLGYFGQCSSGTCPLTSTWWRGGLYGAAMGFLFFLFSGRPAGHTPTTGSIPQIQEQAFQQEVLQANQPVLVDFYAPWCGPCQKLAPIVEQLADQFKGQVKFVKVNVDEVSALAKQYRVGGIPTLLLFRQGKVVDTIVGFVGLEELKKRLQPVLTAGGV